MSGMNAFLEPQMELIVYTKAQQSKHITLSTAANHFTRLDHLTNKRVPTQLKSAQRPRHTSRYIHSTNSLRYILKHRQAQES